MGGQFSIDELLRHDDKKSRYESDAKSISVDEVDEHEEDIDVSNDDGDMKIKHEQTSPTIIIETKEN